MMDTSIDLALKGLADPIRRHTLQRLAQGPATAGQLAALFSVSRPAVSRHLRVLRRAGLVAATSSGRNVWYQARHAPLAELEAWLHDVAKRVADAPAGSFRQAGPERRWWSRSPSPESAAAATSPTRPA